MCSMLIPCETKSNTIVLVLGLDGDLELGIKGLLLKKENKFNLISFVY